MYKKTAISMALMAGLMGAGLVQAAVTAEQAEALKTTLTPLGGERAGNADGSIPEWVPNPSIQVSNDKVGDIPVRAFADEKPLMQITVENMDQYSEHHSDATQALLRKLTQSFRVDVYTTHRTGIAPRQV